MIKNILVTGGAGYIGSHVNEILVKNKKQVYIIDNLSTGHKKLINKKYLKIKKGTIVPFFYLLTLISVSVKS